MPPSSLQERFPGSLRVQRGTCLGTELLAFFYRSIIAAALGTTTSCQEGPTYPVVSAGVAVLTYSCIFKTESLYHRGAWLWHRMKHMLKRQLWRCLRHGSLGDPGPAFCDLSENRLCQEPSLPQQGLHGAFLTRTFEANGSSGGPWD